MYINKIKYAEGIKDLLDHSISFGWQGKKIHLDLNKISHFAEYNVAVKVDEFEENDKSIKYLTMNAMDVIYDRAKRELESIRTFYRFEKQFDSFSEGIKELVEVSDSAYDSLRHYLRKIPETMEEALLALSMNAIMDKEDGNCYFEVSSGGVDYITGGNVGFGWYFAGDGEFGFYDNELGCNIGGYIFYVTHPSVVKRINEKAPADSTLRQSAEKHGWEEVEF